MKSHYVPKMYLKGWSATYKNQEKYICVYVKGRKQRFKPIASIAWLEDYYTDEAEKMFAREIETKTEPILQKIIRKEQITTSERAQLSRFIFLLWQRVPFNRKGLFQQIRQITKPSMLKDMSDMMRAIFIDLELPENTFDVEKPEYTEDDQYSEYEHQLFSELMMRDSYQQYKAFMRMNWRIYQAAPGKEFVTSDNPVFFDRRFGLSDSMFSYFIFPINKNLLLKGKLSNLVGTDFAPISEQETENLNREIVRNCDYQIYASTDDANIKSLVDNYAGDAQKIRHIINIKLTL